jgi:hypothetical protein
MARVPEATIWGLAPFASLFSSRVRVHAQRFLPRAIPAPGARTMTAAYGKCDNPEGVPLYSLRVVAFC